MERIRTSGWAFVWLAVMILILPLQWICAAVIAAAFHECCHIVAIRLCGGRIHGIRITGNGASLKIDMLSQWQELCCSLAGPLGSFLLLFTAKLFPRLAVCALFHGLYNLLPVYPMDGGRALRCFLSQLLGEERSEPVCLRIEKLLLILLFVAGFYAFLVLRIGIFPVFLAGIVICKANIRKFPCKDGLWRVQ